VTERRRVVALGSKLYNDFENRKKSKRHSKELGEKRLNLGCFWFTAVGGSFFWRRKNFRVASLGSEWQTTAHITLILCVSNELFYKSGYAALKCNIGKQTSSKQLQ
jgi:hypothetical protein